MHMYRITALLIVAIHCHSGSFQETNNIKLLTITYETNLNSSIRLEKEGKELRSTWVLNLQVQRINLTTKYRLQMTRHREQIFQRLDSNEKWSECLYLHRRQIRKATKDYFAGESECLTTTTLRDTERTKGVEQVEKEIRKWRRGYRYLVNTCKAGNPNDEQAIEVCLVEYMERDNYNQVIQRLIVLKAEEMRQLYLKLTTSFADYEECLKTQLSTFSEQAGRTVESLNKCYALKTKN